VSRRLWDRLGMGRVVRGIAGGLRARTEPLVKVLSLIPKLVLFIVCASIFLYVVERLLGALRLSGQDPYQALTAIFYVMLAMLDRLLGALATPVEVNAANVWALIAVTVLVATVFKWKTSMYYLLASYIISLVMGIILALTSPILGLGRLMPPGLQLGSGIADLFLFGFLGLLSLNRLILGTIIGWAGSQLTDLVFLAAVMSVLGLVAMYVDKEAAVEASQLLRLPEIMSDPRLDHQRKMEILERARAGEIKVVRIPGKDLVRYALLGGGLGVLAGAILFRHKIRDLGFLAWVTLVTMASLYVLLGGA